MPQWSPLRRSGTTGCRCRARGCWARRRNGTRSGGAGRRTPMGPARHRVSVGARSGGAGRQVTVVEVLFDAVTPQWRPLRRSGRHCPTTMRRPASEPAAMEPAPEERDDAVIVFAPPGVAAPAAMEPAPEERDDRRRARLEAPQQQAAMEPAPEERDDPTGLDRPRARLPAAMEPAPEERDDFGLMQSGSLTVAAPQWSPLRRSGTTEGHRAAGRRLPAAMEPAPEERDDRG